MECFNNSIPQPSPGQFSLPWSVGADAGGAEATAERPLVQRVTNMDHFLPSDTELSQQVDVVAATTRTVLKWIKYLYHIIIYSGRSYVLLMNIKL